MMENRKTLDTSELDGFDKRKLPSPGFMVEVVLMDYDAPLPTRTKNETASQVQDGKSEPTQGPGAAPPPVPSQSAANQDKDDVFSDSEPEGGSTKGRRAQAVTDGVGSAVTGASRAMVAQKEMESVTHGIGHFSVNNDGTTPSSAGDKTGEASEFEVPKMDPAGISDFKAMAADASVFTFGDDEDYESEVQDVIEPSFLFDFCT